MRKILTILTLLLSVSYASAQSVWTSADRNTNYVVFDFSAGDQMRTVLTEKHRPSLDFLSYLLTAEVVDKIRSREYCVWVESYALVDGQSVGDNRESARGMSNIVKSHLILTEGLVEDDFTTRNHSGVFDAMRGAAVVVVGQNYPVEQLSARANVDQSNASTANFSTVDVTLYDRERSKQKIKELGVDTNAILSPKFDVMGFGGGDTSTDDILEPIEENKLPTKLKVYAEDPNLASTSGGLVFSAPSFGYDDKDTDITRSGRDVRRTRKQNRNRR